MANNLFADQTAYYVARVTATFASLNYDVDDTLIIREKFGGASTSWKPDRLINGLLGYTAGRGVSVSPKTTRDEETNLIGGGFIPAGGVDTPAAPVVVVDDGLGRLTRTNVTGYTEHSMYEETVNAGGAWATMTAQFVDVGDVDKAIGQVGIRVRAIGNDNAGTAAYNATEFTGITPLVMSDFNGTAGAAPVADEGGPFTVTTNWEVDGTGGLVNSDLPSGHFLPWAGAANSRTELKIKTLTTSVTTASLGVAHRGNDVGGSLTRIFYTYQRDVVGNTSAFVIFKSFGAGETEEILNEACRNMVEGDTIVCETDATNANISFLGETVETVAHGVTSPGSPISAIYTGNDYVFDELLDEET